MASSIVRTIESLPGSQPAEMIDTAFIELKDGYKFEEVSAAIKADPYFVNDETHVKQVPSVDALLDMGHGVNASRVPACGDDRYGFVFFGRSIQCAS